MVQILLNVYTCKFLNVYTCERNLSFSRFATSVEVSAAAVVVVECRCDVTWTDNVLSLVS